MNSQTKNTVIISLLAVGVIGAVILAGSNNANNANAVDSHGHPSNVAATGDQSTAFSPEELVGKPAPAFSLTDIDGNVYSPESLKGKNVVLFFNEGLMCYPACWNQIASFGKDARFNSGDTIALSVVVDPKKDWGQAIAKMPELAAAKTLFDDGGYASRAFSVLKTPSSMHYGTLPGHTYVVIDKTGIVRYVFDDPRMAIRNDEIFAKISAFNK